MAFALRRRRREQVEDGPYDRAANRPPVTTRATGAAAGAAGSGLLLVARIIRAITWGVVAIIVAAILFTVFEANPSNDVVSTITDWARWLVGPFKDLFSFDSAKTAIAVNFGPGRGRIRDHRLVHRAPVRARRVRRLPGARPPGGVLAASA